MPLDLAGSTQGDRPPQVARTSSPPLALAASRKNSRAQFISVRYRDLPVGGIQLHAHSLVEFSEWHLKRASDVFWRLYIPLSEGALIRFGKSRIPLRPGCLYLISPRTTLITETEKPFSMWMLHFQLGQTACLAGSPPLPAPDTVSEITPDTVLLNLLKSACPEQSEADSQSQQILFLSVLELIIHVLRTPASQSWEIKIRDTRVPALLELARENLSKHGVLDILRHSAGLDKTQLYRLFVAETGFPPMHFLTEMRLEHATNLLHKSALSVQEIAASSGFGDALHLNRMLKKHRNTTTAAVRREAIQ